MKEAIRAKHMDFKNALERKNLRMKEAIWAKHMNFENALKRKNLRMKEAIRAKHMDFENALRFKCTCLRDLVRARSLVAKADDLPTELVKLLWPGGVKYEEVSAMQQSLIQGLIRSRRRLRIQDVSATAFATPRYSAPALERDNVS
ncbi:hypothetical protein Tco_0018768 [Tanacetum coccineum]